MRVTLLVGFALVATASAFVEVQKFYHEEVGIPEAQRIKELEERALASSRSQVTEEGRIVGGVIAPANAHPYLGGLLINFVNIAGTSVCGSCLVSPNRLVTAAHCWNDGRNQASQFLVVLGSQMLFSGGTRIATSNVIMHPQWVPHMLLNDVAMIYLPTSVFFTNSIRSIALPSSWELSDSFVGQWAVAAGYGRTSDQQAGVGINQMVSQVTVQVITVAQCQSVFGVFAQPSNICTNGAGGVGICGGDSGGPLVVNSGGRQILVGISSFVAANGCQLGFPSAFARVTSFHNFITQHL